jgi:bacteriocin-like protein
MLMKYKDFKVMSQNEMKKVMGGYPPDWGSCTVSCGGAVFNTCSCEAGAIFCASGGHTVTSCNCSGNSTCD